MIEIGFPVYSISNYNEEDSFLICGGGGKSKTGVPNMVCIVKIIENKIQLISKKPFDDTVSRIAYDEENKYIAATIGRDLIIFNEKFEEKSRYDLKSENILCKNIIFSIKDNLIAIVDADNKIHILNYPNLSLISLIPSEINSINGKSYGTRISFFNYNDLTVLIIVNEKGVKIINPKSEGKVLFTTINSFGFDPRGINIINERIIISGVNIIKKQSVIIEYLINDNKLISKRIIKPTQNLLTSMNITNKTLSVSDCDGTLYILNQNSFGRIRLAKNIHNGPITSINSSKNFIITGSIDSTITITPNKAKSIQFFLLISLIILSLSILITLIKYIK